MCIRDRYISYLFKPIFQFPNGVNESLILYSKECNTIICVLYRQPTNSEQNLEIEALVSSIQTKINTIEGCTPDIYIC